MDSAAGARRRRVPVSPWKGHPRDSGGRNAAQAGYARPRARSLRRARTGGRIFPTALEHAGRFRRGPLAELGWRKWKRSLGSCQNQPNGRSERSLSGGTRIATWGKGEIHRARSAVLRGPGSLGALAVARRVSIRRVDCERRHRVRRSKEKRLRGRTEPLKGRNAGSSASPKAVLAAVAGGKSERRRAAGAGLRGVDPNVSSEGRRIRTGVTPVAED